MSACVFWCARASASDAHCRGGNVWAQAVAFVATFGGGRQDGGSSARREVLRTLGAPVDDAHHAEVVVHAAAGAQSHHSEADTDTAAAGHGHPGGSGVWLYLPRREVTSPKSGATVLFLDGACDAEPGSAAEAQVCAGRGKGC